MGGGVGGGDDDGGGGGPAEGGSVGGGGEGDNGGGSEGDGDGSGAGGGDAANTQPGSQFAPSPPTPAARSASQTDGLGLKAMQPAYSVAHASLHVGGVAGGGAGDSVITTGVSSGSGVGDDDATGVGGGGDGDGGGDGPGDGGGSGAGDGGGGGGGGGVPHGGGRCRGLPRACRCLEQFTAFYLLRSLGTISAGHWLAVPLLREAGVASQVVIVNQNRRRYQRSFEFFMSIQKRGRSEHRLQRLRTP